MTATTGTNKTLKELAIGYFRDFKVLKETRSEYWGMQGINFLDCVFYFAMLTIAAIFLSNDFNMSDKEAGYVITAFTSATTIFLFISGMITDWLGIRRSLYLALTSLLVLRGVVAYVGLYPDTPYAGWIVAVSLFLMAPFMGMLQTVFQAANKRFTTKRSRSAGFNLWYLFMNVGAAGGGFLIDIIRKGLGVANAHIFSFGVVSAVLCLVFTVLFIRREEQLRIGAEDEAEAAEAAAKEKANPTPKKNPLQIAKAVLSESVFWRFLLLVAALLGVRAVFAYMYLLMPKYWERVIGEDAAIGVLTAINPILIIVGLILFIPLCNRFNIYKMLVYGALISGISLFFLVIPSFGTFTYVTSIMCLVLLSIGEIIWSPKLSEYTAAIAPEGQEGTYLGLSMVPWFLAKTVVSLFSGHMLVRWVPTDIGDQLRAGTVSFWDSPSAMWLILASVAVGGPVIGIIFRRFFTKGARWDATDKREATH